MVLLNCSDALRDRLVRELTVVGIEVSPAAKTNNDPTADATASPLTLVERGRPVPPTGQVILFDALDYGDVVRLLASGLRKGSALPRTVIGQRGEAFVVTVVREIVTVAASADGLTASTATGVLRLRGTLQQLEEEWAAAGFVRANRSELVNLAHVREIVPWFNSRYVLRLSTGNDIEVSKFYAKQLRGRLGF